MINKISAISAVVLTAGIAFQSCVSESPFAASGEGTMRINAEIRGDVTVSTRAGSEFDPEYKSYLENKLVVYIERPNFGLVKKYNGKENLPSSVTLPVGSYIAEAWTGDSVSASWNKKFYRAYKTFDVQEGGNQALTISCNIANVIVSVTKESLSAGLSDLNIRFWHSRCSNLAPENQPVFDEDKINSGSKLYFMMPTADKTTGAKETVINYELTGKKADGSDFKKTGVIENVKSAYEYEVSVSADQKDPTTGGALIRLEVVEVPVIESTIEVFPAPTYSLFYQGETKSLENQLNFVEGAYDASITAVGFDGLRNLTMTFSENFQGQGLDGVSGVNIVATAGDAAVNILKEKGIDLEIRSVTDKVVGTEDGTIKVDEACLSFSKSFFESLSKSTTGYVITLNAVDGKGHESSVSFRFANTEDGIERKAPVGSVDMDKNPDYTAIKTTSAVLYGEIYDAENASNYGIKYRESGSSEWTSVLASATRASTRFQVTVNDLKPGTTYEYKTYCDNFEEDSSRTFTTESVFVIPNASFENWSSYKANTMLGEKDVVLPGEGGDKLLSFWGSGNEGSATANMTLTNKYGDIFHEGSASARLASSKAFGVLAAGNLFAGNYKETYETSNGKLSFGREYNGSHPSKLRVWANYRPGTVDIIKKGMDEFVPAGFKDGPDQGQIYVALTTGPVEVKTGSDRKLFSPEPDGNSDARVVGYGQVTWNEPFGADGSLDLLEIPIEYNDLAKTVIPTHLIIVCSASKFGDYFCGSSTSVMIVDDFELVYE